MSGCRSKKDQLAIDEYNKNPNKCKNCGKDIVFNGRLAETKIKIFCNRTCAGLFNNKHKKKKRTCSVCNVEIKAAWAELCKKCSCLKIRIKSINRLYEKTKGEVFANSISWQGARSCIRKHASNIFYLSSTEVKCTICGYDKFVEVAHIKSVSSFDDNVKLSEINNINNLIGLCPNHHTEYDKGLINLSLYLINDLNQITYNI